MALLQSSWLYGQIPESESRLRLLLFGDVNLGRAVGQELLKGDLEYPFRLVRDTLTRADVVFVNLESQLSDQNGETQHPRYNLIFCGPPIGAAALKQANVSVVSTANNHAFDYGSRALRETIQNLQNAGVLFVGTSNDSVDSSSPAILEKDGIRIGFLAYTQFVNLKGPWAGRIAVYDEQRALREIEALRSKVDVIVASYHGGAEYVELPSEKVRRDFRTLADAGADIVVGHHPHYVQGVQMYQGKLLFYSLGNFVFYQPQLEWTQFGLGVQIEFVRHATNVHMESARLIPVRSGLQPSFVLAPGEEQSFIQRLKKLSPAQLHEKHGAWFIQVQQNDD